MDKKKNASGDTTYGELFDQESTAEEQYWQWD